MATQTQAILKSLNFPKEMDNQERIPLTPIQKAIHLKAKSRKFLVPTKIITKDLLNPRKSDYQLSADEQNSYPTEANIKLKVFSPQRTNLTRSSLILSQRSSLRSLAILSPEPSEESISPKIDLKSIEFKHLVASLARVNRWTASQLPKETTSNEIMSDNLVEQIIAPGDQTEFPTLTRMRHKVPERKDSLRSQLGSGSLNSTASTLNNLPYKLNSPTTSVSPTRTGSDFFNSKMFKSIRNSQIEQQYSETRVDEY